MSWQPIETAPRDGRAFLFCVANEHPVYIGRYANPIFQNVVGALCLCYFSYTETRDKNYFRHNGMIKCGLSASHWMPLPQPPDKTNAALPAVDDEIADLKTSVITFCLPWAVKYAEELGLPKGHLHASHYDILEKCGGRMVDFTRAILEKPND